MAKKDITEQAIDVLIPLYQEESNQARHHEEQRSTGANIIFAIAAALLAVISGVAAIDGGINRDLLPLTISLIALSIAGSLLSKKHFERSMQNYARANAYRDCLVLLFNSDEINTLFPIDKRAKEIKGIGDLVEAKGEQKKIEGSLQKLWKKFWYGEYARMRKGGTGILEKEDLDQDKYTPEKLNPMKPEVYITPLENAKHRWVGVFYLASLLFDLYKLWNRLYLFLFIMGVILTYHAWKNPIPQPKEPVDVRIISNNSTP
jgi:hypothetical protein